GKEVEIFTRNCYIGNLEGIDVKRLSYSIIAVAALAAAPSLAQGRLGLLPQGEYVCALPGNASGTAWNEVPGRNFAITGASSYKAGNGSGTYLMEGKRVTFTRGPMKGKTMMRVSSGMLQEVGRDGKLGRLRCHRAGPVLD
ncbi:MAG: hypothetical protein ACM308_07515, partial [Qipengyuania vulgaris]